MSHRPPKRSMPVVKTIAAAALTVGLCVGMTISAKAQGSKFTSDASGNLLTKTSGGLVAPQIVGQPQTEVVEPGKTARFTVVLADTQGVTYQWRFNNNPIGGATSDTLVLSNVTVANEGLYSVFVSSTAGNATSAAASLFIDTDRDGLADSWEQTNFGNLTQNATGDLDNDGISHLGEFRDGTNPNSNASYRPRLTILTDGGGSVTVTPVKVSYDLGEVVTLTATANPPNTFHGWSGALTTQTSPETLTMSASKTVKAHFISTPIPAGVVSWWRAENNAVDAIGNNNGALVNGVSFATGEVGQAFNFTAANQHVKVNASPTLHVGTGSGLTVETWIKPADLTVRPIAEWHTGSGSGWGAHFWINEAFGGQGGPGCLYTNLKDINNVDHYMFSPAGLLSTTAWQHVAVTYDRTSGTTRLFLNGRVVASANHGNFVPNTTSDLYLGYRPAPTANTYSGLMDEPALYNRALTVDEIFAIHAGGPAGKKATPYFTSPSQLPEAVLAAAYSQQLAATLGTAPLTYAPGSNPLPPGLSLSPAGLLSGTPTIAGTHFFSVRVTDAVGRSTEQTFSLKVLAPVPPPPGVVAWWRAQNNAQDSIGTSHGTLVNGTTFGAGKVGAAFNFDGVDDAVTTPSINAGSKFAVEFWLFPTRSAGYEHLVSNSGGSVNYGDLYFRDNHIEYWQGGGQRNSTPSSIPLNTWTHVAMTYDGEFSRIYVNGVLQSQSAPHTETFNNTLSFGYTNAPSNNRFKGLLDEIAIYNRALRDADIALLHSAGLAGKTTAGPLFNTPGALPDGYVSQPYSQTIAALRTSGATSYSVTNGSLPPGLSLSPAGLLNGTPTTPGTYTFTVRLTDASALFAEQVFTLAVYAAVPPPAGLVSWWRGQNDAQDSISANHGTLMNGATFGTGKIGTAFSFDGGDDQITIPSINAGSKFTVEFWLFPKRSAGYEHLVSNSGGSANYGDLYFRDNHIEYWQGGVLRASSPVSSVPLLTWSHIALTYDGGVNLIYVNGVPLAVSANHSEVFNNSLAFGYTNAPSNNRFQGLLDEISLYDRALGSSEIAALNSAGSAGKTIAGPYFNTPPTLPEALVATPYSHTVTTLRGTAPVTFSVIGGSLPPGLTLNSSGLLSGTPTTAGLFSFTVRATDANTLQVDQIFTLQVLPKVSPPAGIIGWWRGQNDTQDSIGSNHGTLVNGAAFASAKVGSGFNFDGVDDMIEIPSINAGPTYTVELWIYPTRSAGHEHLVTYDYRSAGFGGLFFRDNHIEYVQGSVVRVSSIAGSVPLFTWTHVALTFENGTNFLYLNGALAGISGPHSETFNSPLGFGWTVVSDTNNHFAGRLDEIAIYNLALSPAEIVGVYSAGSAGKTLTGPYINTPTQLPEGTVGLAYAQTFTALRGTNPITFSLVGGSLPPGLTLLPNGSLSGTPTSVGDFSFLVRATDNAGLFGDQQVNLRISTRSRISLGAVAWWRAEANAQDSIGANHGTLWNGASFATGKVGQALKFDGANDYVTFPDAPSLRPLSLSLEAWVRFDATPTGIRSIIAKPLGNSFLDTYTIWWENGNLRAGISDNGGAGAWFSYPFSPVPGRWYHIAYTFNDAINQQVFYLDGVTIAIGTETKSPSYDTRPLLLGADIENGGFNYFFQGAIDEVALYNRALTAQEIASVYQARGAGKRLFFPLETWKLNNLGNADALNGGDPDGDSVPNLLEYTFGLNPSLSDAAGMPQVSTFNYPEGRRLRIIFPRDPAKNDVTIEVQVTDNLLGSWTTIASSIKGAPTSGAGYVGGDGTGPGIKQVEVRDTVNMSAASRRFMRIKVSQ